MHLVGLTYIYFCCLQDILFYTFKIVLGSVVAGIALSVSPLRTGCTVRGPNTGGGEIFRISPEWSWGPPSLLYIGYRVTLAEVKWPWSGVGHPPPCRAIPLLPFCAFLTGYM